MSNQLVRTPNAEERDIGCNAGDALVANFAVHVVFFFPRRLDTAALMRSFAIALKSLPIFDGRMGIARGRMRIRCRGQGVPFTSVSSGRTLGEAIRATAQDGGMWLIDPVNGVAARWGWGPLCKVRVTQLAGDATAIGLSWHHAVGDMQTVMYLMNAWAAAAAGGELIQPLIAEDRAAYLDEHLPAEPAREPGIRFLKSAELVYLARQARKQRFFNLYFGEAEIARMRDAYGSSVGGSARLSANDVVCAHVAEAIMDIDGAVDHRTLAILVNVRNRCGLDPMLAGNMITTLNLDVRRHEPAASIARRIRHAVDHFADEHCNMRANQQFLDTAGRWRSAWCVSTTFDAARWNPVVTNWSGFGVYRIQFEDTFPCYFTPLTNLPVGGIAILMDGADGRGLVFSMFLPRREFAALSQPAMQARLHSFRDADDDIPPLHRELHG